MKAITCRLTVSGNELVKGEEEKQKSYASSLPLFDSFFFVCDGLLCSLALYMCACVSLSVTEKATAKRLVTPTALHLVFVCLSAV